MEDSFMFWGNNLPSFDSISNGLFLGIIAGIGEAAIVHFILDIFGVFERGPIFG
ncbi:hypothetical protein [Sulfuricurvum sp.]|uniref:hypothetical protein n=1 Tax=Sulfuricurvum sp. TaxID=2025608 RepID=UPI002630DD04|nr:hypothetical protein [Sulfuricurvum sp.]MDD2781136.1 hypothetical protein [Sulfuricurvum sp.]